MRSGSAQRGFTYLAMLIAVAVIGVGFAAAGEMWSTVAQREKEQELLFVGNQYRRAIRFYYQNTLDQRTPGVAYPKALKDLLEDQRRGDTKHHLRKLYRDPMTGKAEWGLVTIKAPDGDRIMGVYSLSSATPFKTSGFLDRDRTFEGANHFSDWKFLHELETTVPAQQTPKPAAPPPAPTK